MRRFLIIGTLIFSCHTFANNPSFDCAKAKTFIEKTICSSQDLSQYDAMLAENLEKAKTNPQFKKDYLAWLKARNSCDKDKSSLFFLRKNTLKFFH